MSIYFAFSDENGSYMRERNERFLKTHPLYIRATFIMLASEWKILSDGFRQEKQNYGFPLEKEVKWSYIWSLFKHQRNGEEIPENKPYHFLAGVDYSHVLDFIESALLLFSRLSYLRIILTVTFNDICPKINEPFLYGMHIQNTMQRIEMEIQRKKENLCVLFLDAESEGHNKLFRDIYFELYQEGDFIRNYSHILDSLNLEYSHHSVGIQLSDYAAGSFSAFLRGFSDGKRVFNNRVKPYLRHDASGDMLGYGITEIPRYDIARSRIREDLAA